MYQTAGLVLITLGAGLFVLRIAVGTEGLAAIGAKLHLISRDGDTTLVALILFDHTLALLLGLELHVIGGAGGDDAMADLRQIVDEVAMVGAGDSESLAGLLGVDGQQVVHVMGRRLVVPAQHGSDDGLKALQEVGFDGYIRPDHGRMIWGEVARPGYGLYDRALGVSYLNGLWEAVEKSRKE